MNIYMIYLKKGLKVERLLAVISKLQFCNFEIMEQKEIFVPFFHVIVAWQEVRSQLKIVFPSFFSIIREFVHAKKGIWLCSLYLGLKKNRQ